MYGGVGDESEEDFVPPVLFEIEVETEMSPADVEGGSSSEVFNHGPYRPHNPSPKLKLPMKLAPFHTPREFGVWLFDVMIVSKLNRLNGLLGLYYEERGLNALKTLLKFGRIFKKINYLYYLEGMFRIAVSKQHKRYIRRVYCSQMHHLWQTEE